jgi:hypothetical protein
MFQLISEGIDVAEIGLVVEVGCEVGCEGVQPTILNIVKVIQNTISQMDFIRITKFYSISGCLYVAFSV